MQNDRVLKDLACVNLQYAVSDIEIDGGKASIAHALAHVREVEACLRLLLIEIGGPDNDLSGAKSG